MAGIHSLQLPDEVDFPFSLASYPFFLLVSPHVLTDPTLILTRLPEENVGKKVCEVCVSVCVCGSCCCCLLAGGDDFFLSTENMFVPLSSHKSIFLLNVFGHVKVK